jgi:Trypsin-like peptidase domain
MTEYSKEPSFKETGLASPITEIALALTASKDGVWRPSGTAVVIGPHLAITAKHVIEDYWKKYEGIQIEAEVGERIDEAGSFHIFAFQVLEEGKTGALWEVTRIWLSPFTDVAFIRLTPYSEAARKYKWRVANINLLPPEVGTRISGFGYHSSAISVKESERGIEIEWKDSPTTTIGEVIEVFQERRDPIMLPFPCFRTNARFDGGMSGGPIFNEQGNLCGIICSYVASLWPSMATEIDMDREDFPKNIYYPVLELAQYKHIQAKNWEKIVVLKKPDGTPQVRLNI